MSGPELINEEELEQTNDQAVLDSLAGKAGAKGPGTAGLPNSAINAAVNPGGEGSDPELLSKIKGRGSAGASKQGAPGDGSVPKSAPPSTREQRALKLDTIPIKSEFTKLAKISHTMFGLSGSIKEYNNLVALIADKLPQLNTEITVMYGAVSPDESGQDPVQRSAGVKAKADVVLDLLEEAGRHPKCSESKREYLWNVYEIIKREAYTNLPGSDEEQGGAYHASDSHKTLFPTGDALRQGISQALESVKAKSAAQHDALMGQGSGIVSAIGAKLDTINAVLKGFKLPPKSSITKISEKQAVAKEIAGAINSAVGSTYEIKEALNGYIGSKNVSKNPKVMGALSNVIPRCDSGIAALRNIYDVVLRYYHDGATPFEIDGKTLFSLSTEILTAASSKPKPNAKTGKGGLNEVVFAEDAKWGNSVIKASGEETTKISKTKSTAATEKGKAAKKDALSTDTYGVKGDALGQAVGRFFGLSGNWNVKTRSEAAGDGVSVETTTQTVKHNLATRDVSVGRVSKLLGFDSIVNTRITQSDLGDKDITMDAAKGREAFYTDFYLGGGGEKEGEIPKEAKKSALLKRLINATNSAKEEEINKDRSGHFKEQIKKFGPAKFQDVYEANTIISLMRMKIVDAIARHNDRHRDNFFYDPETKQFVGIDNDLSFIKEKDIMQTAVEQHTFSLDKDVPCIDEETKAAVMAVSNDDLYGILLDALPREFVDAAVLRLEAVKNYIAGVDVVEKDEIGAKYKEKTDKNIEDRISGKKENKSKIYAEDKKTGLGVFGLMTNAAEGLTTAATGSMSNLSFKYESVFSADYLKYSNEVYSHQALLGKCADSLLEKCGWDLDAAFNELDSHNWFIDKAAGRTVEMEKAETE